MHLVVERALAVEVIDGWPLDALPASPYGGADIAFRSGGHGSEIVFESASAISFVSLEDGSCFLRVAASDSESASNEADALKKWLGRAEAPEEGLAVRFWAMGSMGPFSIRRPVDAPNWTEIEANYPREMREELGGLMSSPLDVRGGQMMIWHGPPGTGKTWALRCLGREWAGWCDFEYVTDPDRFLEDGAAYLLQVLLEGASEFEDEDERWRLLVLEDAGELLASDARDRVGQGLSRFLNAADGFLGQGLRTIMLVTTNEPMESMHPAVARPGRCFAQVEFGPFPVSEAAEWLNREVQEDMTLAEMYAERRGAE